MHRERIDGVVDPQLVLQEAADKAHQGPGDGPRDEGAPGVHRRTAGRHRHEPREDGVERAGEVDLVLVSVS